MNIFAENLQYYRKQKDMTQEQLAECMAVSRQTISKWELGASYPEMEKILQLCDLFACDMDVLMRKNVSEMSTADGERHRVHMMRHRRQITLGVVIMIGDMALYELLTGIGVPEVIMNTVFMAVVIVAVLIFVVAGMRHDNYKKKYPVVQDPYTADERERFEERFPVMIATGIGMILVGFLIGMNGDVFPRADGMTEDFYYGIFMLLVAIAVGICVYGGLGKEMYDVKAYNKENNLDEKSRERNEKVGVWCGCIMLIATIIFLIMGFVFHMWEICWVVYPVGGLMCGIVSIILNGKKRLE